MLVRLFDAARRDDCACALECHVTMLVSASLLRHDTLTQQISPVACPRTHKQLKCTMWIPPIPPGRSRNPKCARRICDQLLQTSTRRVTVGKVVIVLFEKAQLPKRTQFSGRPVSFPGPVSTFLWETSSKPREERTFPGKPYRNPGTVALVVTRASSCYHTEQLLQS